MKKIIIVVVLIIACFMVLDSNDDLVNDIKDKVPGTVEDLQETWENIVDFVK